VAEFARSLIEKEAGSEVLFRISRVLELLRSPDPGFISDFGIISPNVSCSLCNLIEGLALEFDLSELVFGLCEIVTWSMASILFQLVVMYVS